MLIATETVPSDYAKRITRLRVRLGLTQPELAAQLEVSARSISRWERGQARPTARAWQGLVRLDANFTSAPTSDYDRPRAEAGTADVRAGHNLPAALTSFIGREREVTEVRKLLLRTRLLTLWGPAGCGKTRLAFEAAGGVLGQFPDGVRLVQLEALTDPALVPRVLADALGIGEESGRPLLETLAAYLRPRTLLLVLDTCEHLLDACATLAEALLSACPQVHILATSCHTLAIGSETVWRVAPLSVPAARGAAEPDTLSRAEAVRLFVERAAAYNPGFSLNASSAVAVAEVCRRLDGLPLAIELAARVVVVPVEQLVARLNDRFELLVEGSRTAPLRHRTLRALVDSSYELLTRSEQEALQCLAVFADGFGLDAAEAVCPAAELQPETVLGILQQLVQKSLVEAGTQNREARYHLLETLRQYALERLTASGQAAAVQARHAAYYLALAPQRPPQPDWPREATWLEPLAGDEANVRAAVCWYYDQGPTDACARLALVLWRMWNRAGQLNDEREPLDNARVATVLERLGLVTYERDEHTSALSSSSEATAIAHEVGTRLALRSEDQSELSISIRPGSGHLALTVRERMVIGLIANGRSNRSIARQLVVSVRTVERHVSNIYAKIEAHGRADATAYALRHRLACLMTLASSVFAPLLDGPA